MAGRNICPSCKTPNEYSAQKCISCAADISNPGHEEASTVFVLKDNKVASSPRARLLLSARDGKVIEVKDGDIVGRNAVGKEILEQYEEVSRRHAQFVRRTGTWSIMDLGSSNGTFLDGVRLPANSEVPVRNLQVLKLSPFFEVTVRVDEDIPPAKVEEQRTENSRRTMVILFADLKGSVDVFQEKGTIMARNWIVNLYRMLTSIIDSHRGMHIKNIGDAILAVFDDPYEAAAAAIEMQSDLKRHNSETNEADHYYMRIGMNIGTVLLENNDVFGNSVNIASRVQAIAPPERIFITGGLYEAIKENRDFQFRFNGNEQLKGVRGMTAIYEMLSIEASRAADENIK